MNMNNVMSMVVAFITCLMMIILAKTEIYNDASSNILFLMLLLFFMVMIGLGVAKLFGNWFSDGIEKQSDFKKDVWWKK